MTDHRIASVEGIVIRAPRSREQARDEDPSSEALIVVVRTAGGLAGFGECNHHPRAAYSLPHSRGGSLHGPRDRPAAHRARLS